MARHNIHILTRTQAGDTALILASFLGHLEVVKALLAAGANMEVKNQVSEGITGQSEGQSAATLTSSAVRLLLSCA